MPTDPDALSRARAAWRYRGQQRPDFALAPAAGQESVWDYPRPPAYVPDARRVEIKAGASRLAYSETSLRVLETGSPPSLYLPPEAVERSRLRPSARRSLCEWKGQAHYFHVESDKGLIADAVWSYPNPLAGAESLAGWFAFYPALLDCRLGGERVRAQAGGFYGGWITSEIVGPFKGDPGTAHW
ncbi:hypothetical protein CKO25_12440 [Thiocapsa imhoffii]|uniref:DUF427 domain-containing protein n=1 Tax=Thiocapsa imhoffii TaxID=382777 RepID=A0A9X1B9L7_9GAMM|nr:DUF427 domain-containing protein [Thiocapsa imhoffii]MBK1645438.1 hypothetical protein [Thiocapsa imhoffii]